jgi:GPH family glycoside/pentoside/hexuronide:cation symporter
VVFIIGGFSTTTNDLMPRSMMADVNDEDRLRSGSDRMGMLYALLALTMKLGQAISIGVVYLILDLVGFKAAAGMSNSAFALHAVLLLGSAVPAALYLSAAFCAWRYPLTAARHDAIRKELALRHIAAVDFSVSPVSLVAESGFGAPLPVADQLPLDDAPKV